jgi:hypothetical protein
MHKIYQILSILFAVMLLVSCLPNSQQVPEGWGQTEAAYTMVAVLTQSAFQTVEAKLTEVSKPTGTPVPEETILPASTPIPASTGIPTLSSAAATQPSYISKATGTLCNQIGSVIDMSIPDGTAIQPGATFTKIWRLMNNGTCTWTTSYDLIFSNGYDLTPYGKKDIPLPKEVKPGDSVDVSILLQAPTKTGTYTSYYQLQDQNGNVFGGGPKGQAVFWVKIKSGGHSDTSADSSLVYSLASSTCYASWFTANGLIACPENANPETGSVISQNSVTTEDDSTISQPTIITVPNKGGVISGQFPSILINKDDIFSATIGCVNGHPECNISFTVGYKTTDGKEGTLGTWTHTAAGPGEELNLDLTKLATHTSSLILTVNANNKSADNIGYWISPRVWH